MNRMTTLLMLINFTTIYLPYSGSQNSTSNYPPYTGSQNSTTEFTPYTGRHNSTTELTPYTGKQNSTTNSVPYTGSQNSTTDYLPNTGSQNSKTNFLPYTSSQNSTPNYPPDTGSQDSTTISLSDTGSQDSTTDSLPDTGSQDSTTDSLPDTGSQDSTTDFLPETGSQDSTTDFLLETGSQDSTTDSLPDTGSQDSTTDSIPDTGSQDSTADSIPDTGSQDSTTDFLPDTGSQDSTTDSLPDTGSQEATSDSLPDTGSQDSTTDFLPDTGSQDSTTESLPYSLSETSTILTTLLFGKISNACGAAPYVNAANVAINRNQAIYKCYTGYIFAGRFNNLVCFNGDWRGNLPICKLQNIQPIGTVTTPKIIVTTPIGIAIKPITNDNKTEINNHIQSVPLWLLIILGAVGVCAALLFLCCMLACCLKCLGCWHMRSNGDKGSFWSRRDNRIHNDPSNRTNNMATAKNKTTKTVHGNLKSNNNSQLTNTSIVPEKKLSTAYQPPGYAKFIEAKQRAAKPPADKWMPHKKDVRPNNTSTK